MILLQLKPRPRRADDILKKSAAPYGNSRRLIKRGVLTVEDGWGGWLGKYQAAVREAASQLDQKDLGAREELTTSARLERIEFRSEADGGWNFRMPPFLLPIYEPRRSDSIPASFPDS